MKKVETTDGREPEIEYGHGAPTAVKLSDGQHAAHWILSADERAKGFVRPVRNAYQHVGQRPRHPLRELDEEEKERYAKYGYVAFEAYPPGEGSVTGRFWTQEQLTGGCGTTTYMPMSIAETYAAEPDFYGSTFCAHCGDYFPVGPEGEFVWTDDGSRVGS